MARFYIRCTRTSGSILGPATAPMKNGGEIVFFDTKEEAQAAVDSINKNIRSTNLYYTVCEWVGN